jgi:hypothetical protein
MCRSLDMRAVPFTSSTLMMPVSFVIGMGMWSGYKTVAPERKLTTVLFTTSYTPHPTDTDHFSGGELLFNYLCDRAWQYDHSPS